MDYRFGHVVLRAEGMAGASLQDTGRDLCVIANHLGIPVRCLINDVDVLVNPGDSVEDVGERYERLRSALTPPRS